MKISTGIFDPDSGVFSPDCQLAYAEARSQYGALQAAFAEAIEVAAGDWDQVIDYLNVTDSIPDRSHFAWSLDRIVSAPYDLEFDHYIAYKWVIAVLKHTLTHGEVVYENRCVLLDKSEPDDWFVAQYI